MGIQSERTDEHPEESKSLSRVQQLGLNPFEVRVVEAIRNRGRKESLESIAHKLGISRRTLYEYLQDPRIQEAVQELASDHLKIDFASVLGEVARKARGGNMAAAKLLLEQANRTMESERKHKIEMQQLREAFVRALQQLPKELQEKIANELKIAPPNA